MRRTEEGAFEDGAYWPAGCIENFHEKFSRKSFRCERASMYLILLFIVGVVVLIVIVTVTQEPLYQKSPCSYDELLFVSVLFFLSVSVLRRPAFCIENFFASKIFAKTVRCKNFREKIFATNMEKAAGCATIYCFLTD